MDVTFFVTKNDILHGAKGDCEKCAVARAVERRLKADFFCTVSGYGEIKIHWIKNRVAVRRANNAGKPLARDFELLWSSGQDDKREAFIKDFDSSYRRVNCKPFMFKLNIPDSLGWVLAK